MPDYTTAIELMRQQDNGYLILLFMVVYASIVLYWQARKRPRVGRALALAGPGLVPFLTVFYSPLAALGTVLAAIAANRAKIHIKRPLVAVLGLAVALRLPLLFNSLWFDEAFTSRLIHLPLAQLPGAIMADVHPPLYYLALWPLAQLTDSPALLRLPSLLVGLLSIVLVFRLVQRLGLGQPVALITAFLWAVLPASIYYSVELRSYEVLLLFVLLLALAILENRPRRFAVLLAALCWLHNVGFIYALVIGLAGLAYWHNRRWFLAAAVGGAGGALWLPFLIQQAATVNNGYWTYISPGMVFQPLLSMVVGVIGGAQYTGVAAVVVIGLTVISLILMSEYSLFTGRGLLWLVFVFAVPILEAVISFMWKPIYVHRHFLPNVMLLVIAWAFVLQRFKLARVMVAPVLCLGLFAFYTSSLPFARPDYRAWIDEHCQGANVGYATSINAAFLISENSDLEVYLWPGAVDAGMTLDPGSMAHFNYEFYALPPVRACVLAVEVPATTQAERDYIQSLLTRFPHQAAEYILGDMKQFRLYNMDLGAVAAPAPVDWFYLNKQH